MLGFLTSLFGHKKVTRKTLDEYKHEMLVSTGREQFKAMLKKNIRIPVVFL